MVAIMSLEKNIWKKYFRTEVVDNKNVHYCSACDFNTTIQKDMSFHVRKHLKKSYPYACDEVNCDKAFKTKAVLNEHRTDHRCGFGIKGMEDIGICGVNAIKWLSDERIGPESPDNYRQRAQTQRSEEHQNTVPIPRSRSLSQVFPVCVRLRRKAD